MQTTAKPDAVASDETHCSMLPGQQPCKPALFEPTCIHCHKPLRQPLPPHSVREERLLELLKRVRLYAIVDTIDAQPMPRGWCSMEGLERDIDDAIAGRPERPALFDRKALVGA